jgi:hypothetical protein
MRHLFSQFFAKLEWRQQYRNQHVKLFVTGQVNAVIGSMDSYQSKLSTLSKANKKTKGNHRRETIIGQQNFNFAERVNHPALCFLCHRQVTFRVSLRLT